LLRLGQQQTPKQISEVMRGGLRRLFGDGRA
jgi:hypothetical protein